MPPGAAGVYPTRPPEVNSGTVESGAGSGTWQAAAAAFESFAGIVAQLGALFASSSAEEVALRGGITADTLQAQAPGFIAWVAATEAALMAKGAASSAAGAAFEATRAGVIPVPAINANRVAEANAQATNFLGVNSALIAQLNTLYAQFWSQDGTTLVNYDSAINMLTAPIPISPPPPIGNEPQTAANAAFDAAQSAAMTAQQGATQAASQSATQPTQQLAQSVSQGSGVTDQLGSLGGMVTQPLSMVSSLPQTLMSPMQSLTSPLSSALGQLGQMGSGQFAFGPTPTTGFGTGAPLHTGGLGTLSGSPVSAGGGGLGGGGIGGFGAGAHALGTGAGSTGGGKKTSVFSGVPMSETVGTGNRASGPMGGPMGAGAHGAGGGKGGGRRAPEDIQAITVSDEEMYGDEVLTEDERKKLFS